MATSIADNYTDTPIKPDDTIPLDFDSIRDLPESHVWTSDEVQAGVGFDEANYPSIIDLRAPNVTELVGNACRKWGMFHVTNHGVPMDIVEKMEEQARRLFSLPTDRKLMTLRKPLGAAGYGVARISPFFEKAMWHEGFAILESTVENAKLLWPHEYQEFCDVVEEYKKEMKLLCNKILGIIFSALGLDEEAQGKVISAFFEQPTCTLQLNSYPICPNPSRAVGMAPHTDTMPITILHQNDTFGLQNFEEGVGWIPIPPIKGVFVINLGDLMHVLSNGCFKPAFHRAMPNAKSQRLTLVFFYGPPFDSVVAPLPEASPPPRFRAFTVREFVAIKSKHYEKSISMVGI